MMLNDSLAQRRRWSKISNGSGSEVLVLLLCYVCIPQFISCLPSSVEFVNKYQLSVGFAHICLPIEISTK